MIKKIKKWFFRGEKHDPLANARKLNMDDDVLSVLCPLCGNKTSESFRRIKSTNSIPCVCGHKIDIVNLKPFVNMLEQEFFRVRDQFIDDLDRS